LQRDFFSEILNHTKIHSTHHTPPPILLPDLPPRTHALFLLLWPPSAFFFHLFATMSNIVIRKILFGATTRFPWATLHGDKELYSDFMILLLRAQFFCANIRFINFSLQFLSSQNNLGFYYRDRDGKLSVKEL